jgi:hypothetical protein
VARRDVGAPRNKSAATPLLRFDFGQMERDISIELLEERDSVANQDRQDRISKFVCKPETKTFAADCTVANEPNVTELGSRVRIDELRKIA